MEICILDRAGNSKPQYFVFKLQWYKSFFEKDIYKCLFIEILFLKIVHCFALWRLNPIFYFSDDAIAKEIRRISFNFSVHGYLWKNYTRDFWLNSILIHIETGKLSALYSLSIISVEQDYKVTHIGI